MITILLGVLLIPISVVAILTIPYLYMAFVYLIMEPLLRSIALFILILL